MPLPGRALRIDVEGGGRRVSDLSMLRVGDVARRAAREWREDAVWGWLVSVGKKPSGRGEEGDTFGCFLEFGGFGHFLFGFCYAGLMV